MDSTTVERLTGDAPPVVQFGYTGAGTGLSDLSSISCPSQVTNQKFWSVREYDFRRVSPIAETLERLQQIEGLGPNWDSYGSEAPSHVAVATAHSLIWAVYIRSVNAGQRPAVPYSVVPLSGGGVQVDWRGDAAAIEVEISSEGVLGYLLARGSEPSRELEEADNVSQSRILQLIRDVI